MPREVTDKDGVRWTCLQAYAGLSNDPEKQDAARVEGTDDRFRVVCTPSGGSQTVELELPGGWEEKLSDDDLLAAIAVEQRQGG